MNNAPLIKAGDRIRAVFEGVIEKIDSDGEVFFDRFGTYNARFYPGCDAVTSIEVVKPPLAVGDRGEASELNAPIGALLRCTRNQFHLLVTARGLSGTGGFEPEPASYYTDLYEVVYLPASAATSSTCEGCC